MAAAVTVHTRTPHLDTAPDLLGDLIRCGHAVRGLRRELAEDASAAVDRAAPTFLATVPEPKPDDDEAEGS